jgi:ABC-2 type transport system ATP-binding protein
MSSWGLDDASVRVGHQTTLDGVDLDVADGDVTSVVGGDGAGKTTLARLLVGLLRPSRGRVRRPERRQVGYQSEASGVWGDLTVDENLSFVAAAHGIGSGDRARRIAELLEVTHLGAARDRLAAQLSGGMRQKLGVAMALLPNPRLLVLDEPTTGLDPVSRTELWSVIARAAAEGAAILATTTYLEEAERGTTVLALEQGRTLAAGTIDEVRRAMTGVIAEVGPVFDGPYRWRRGGSWRAWFPNGDPPTGAVAVDPDLTDLLTVAAFNRRDER